MEEQADENGCSEGQRDDDGDGVPNFIDRCPYTPSGSVIDDNGCETGQLISDNDGDGLKMKMIYVPTPQMELLLMRMDVVILLLKYQILFLKKLKIQEMKKQGKSKFYWVEFTLKILTRDMVKPPLLFL